MLSFRKAYPVILAVVLSVMLIFAAGCARQETPPQRGGSTAQDSGKTDNQAPPAGDRQQADGDQQPKEEKVILTLYFGNKDATGVTPEEREVVKSDKPLEQLIIGELVKGPATGLARTIPAETRLLSVTVKDGVATVDFSREVQTKHWGGTAGEAMTIHSVVASLTELDYIKKVQFLVEGKKEEAIWGHADTTRPIGRNPQMITK